MQLVFPHEKTDWNEYLYDAIDTFVTIAKTIQKYQKVLIIAKNLSHVKSLFHNKKNLIFIRIDSDDTWSRDFGGITVEENGKFKVLDFTFNGWGKKYPAKLDNKITQQLKLKGLFKQYQHQTIPFVLEGGSIDSDGFGTLMTTTSCLLEKNRNPQLTKSSIEKQLINSFGAKKILWLNSGYLIGDDTDGHIDTLARFVSKNTIVYQECDDENDEHYSELLKMKEELEKFTQINGNTYQLIPLPWISPKYYKKERLPATYVNFLIINKAVLLPTYQDKNDKKALKIFKNIFPQREIIAIDCSTLIRQHGSLHCVTMQYPKPKGTL